MERERDAKRGRERGRENKRSVCVCEELQIRRYRLSNNTWREL